jgi:hypothetical protein
LLTLGLTFLDSLALGSSLMLAALRWRGLNNVNHTVQRAGASLHLLARLFGNLTDAVGTLTDAAATAQLDVANAQVRPLFLVSSYMAVVRLQDPSL